MPIVSISLPLPVCQILEEFETDDGVPYWFDRRTGETFWERPLCEEEKVCGSTGLGHAAPQRVQ